ncbi:ATP-binding cassette domain-containing protein [Vagococcus entomophilus]|uniref:ABC transporter ATP-binding protein n=1 Tax=Vagococcus entomophilus TaxID=1160095 RepID=A0A430AFF9_9ENTE|nr:ABC transporter ATP-binding protein [Vagococcus entomophilus]RSU06458.1 hypothetical protein CBF30_09390 [Vagococcus entomophilus]
MVFKTIKKFWKYNFLLTFLITLESGGIILSTVYLSKIMDSLINSDKYAFLESFAISLFLWLIALILGYIKNIHVEYAKQKQVLYIRNKILSSISVKSYEEFHEKQINEYISWLTLDINTLEEQCFGNFYLAISSFTLIVFSAIAILKFSYVLLIIAIVAAIIMTIVPNRLRKQLDIKNTSLSKKYEKYISKVDEWIKGFPTLISYNKNYLLKQQLNIENEKIANLKSDLGKTKAIINSIIRFLSVVFQYSIIFVTGIFVLSGRLSGGVIFSIGDLTGNFFGNMSFFINEVTMFFSTSKIIDKINFDNSLDVPRIPLNDNEFTFFNQIKIKNLEYDFPNSQKILIPDMNFIKGGKYAILGKSGTGKTTFLNILSKNLGYTKGTIEIDGQNINNIDTKKYRDKISYVKQKPYIFDLSLFDNVTLLDNFDKEKVEKIIDKIELTDLENIDSLGLFGKNISGGQAQRVEIGRSLIQEKDILLIDEGTSNLDSETSYIIEKAILLNPELTVIFVTHHLNPVLEKMFTDIYEF